MQRKAMTKLVGLQFILQYKKGPENIVVDALSRVGQFLHISAVSSVVSVWIQEVVSSYSMDSEAKRLLVELVVLSPNDKGYSLHDGLIRFKGKIWVGDNSALQAKIIQKFHSSALGGHSGIQATT
jgi:hypothetical protein